MGLSSFFQRKPQEPKKEEKEEICVECNIKNQKELPLEDTTSSEGMPCEVFYNKVDTCMKNNGGQVSSCTKEWKEFQDCHQKYKLTK